MGKNNHKKILSIFILSAVMFFSIFLLYSNNKEADASATSPAGVGYGAIATDASNDIAIGTSTTLANTKLFIIASTSDSSAYGITIYNSNNSSIFSVRNDGTVTAPVFSGGLVGNLDARNVFSGQFGANTGGGDYYFPGKVGIGTTAPNGTLTIYKDNLLSATQGDLLLEHPTSGGASSIVFTSRANYGSDYGYLTYYDSNSTYAFWGTSSENSALVIGTQNDGMNSVSDVVALRGAAADVFGTNTYPTTMIVNDAGNVGIGTTAPSQKLEVIGNVSSTGICLGGTCNTTWPNSSQWTTNGSNIYYNGGNVGIGTTNPSGLLSVVGNNSGGELNVLNNTATNYTTAIIQQTVAGGNGNQDIGLVVNTQGAADTDRIVNFGYYNAGTPISRFVVTRGGNVGIGTTSPANKLDVNGNADIQGGLAVGTTTAQSTGNALFTGTVTAGGFSGPLTGVESANNVSSGSFGANTGGGNYTFTSNVYFAGSGIWNSSGNVGIGTTAPGYKLDVSGNIRSTGYVFSSTKDEKTYTLTNGDGWYRIVSNGGGGQGGRIKIWNIGGSNIMTDITFYVSGMGYSQGSSINILNNVFYNGTHISYIRAGSDTNSNFVVDVYLTGTSNPTTMYVEKDGNIALLASPIFNPIPPSGGVMTVSGQVLGGGSSRWPYYFSGNVGIGTTSPANLLDVNGNADIQGGLAVGTTTAQSTGNALFTGTVTAAGFSGPLTGVESATNVSSGQFGANTGGGTYSFPGNVGIGTTAPNEASLQFANSLGNKVVFYSNGTGLDYGLGINGSNLAAFIPSGAHFSLRQNSYSGSEVSTIDYSGNAYFAGQVSVANNAIIQSNGTIESPGSKNTTNGMIETYYNAGDRYGLGQFSNGVLSLYTSDAYTPSSIAFGRLNASSSFINLINIDHNGNLTGVGNANFNGTVTAGGFSGPLTGVESANNVSSGSFGANTGGGNYAFPSNGNVYFPGSGIWNSSGNVGIGTTSPNTNLQVTGAPSYDNTYGINLTNGATDFGRTQLRLTGRIQGGNDGWGLNSRNIILFAANANTSGLGVGSLGTDKFGIQYYMAGDQLGIISSTGGSNPLMVFNQNGNVGIGTTSPGAKLQVNGTEIVGAPGGSLYDPYSNLHVTSNAPQTNLTLETQGLMTGAVALNSSGIYLGAQSGGNIYLTYGTPYNGNYAGGGSTALFVNGSTGNVGIGTTAPTNPLTVVGNANFTGTVTAGGFSGPLTGVESANNVSSGSFGANTGGGNYTFPGALSVNGSLTTPYVYIGSGESHFWLGTYNDPNYGVSNAIKIGAGGIAVNGTSVFNNNVGIGTTNPTHKLEVSGSSYFSGGSGSYISGVSLYPVAATGPGLGNIMPLSTLSGSGVAANANGYAISALFTKSVYSVSNSGNANGGNFYDILSSPASLTIQAGAGNSSLMHYYAAPVNAYTLNSQTLYEYGFYSNLNANPSTGVNAFAYYGNGSAPSYFGGNVGIGTTSPGAKLDVFGNLILGDGTNNFNAYIRGVVGTSYAWNINSLASGLQIQSTASGATGLTIQSGGNVGIGTTSPANKLDVSGSADIMGGLAVGTTTPQSGGYGYFTGSITANGGISANGVISAGTSLNSYIGNITNVYSTIVSATNAGGVAIYGQSNQGSSFAVEGMTTATGGYGLYGFANATGAYDIGGEHGEYTNSSGQWINASDRRLKTDIVPLSDSLSKIEMLTPVSFKWKDTATMGSQENIGLIAQDVQPVFPELVSENASGTLGLNYAGFVSPIIGAIKEQQQEIELLKTQNATLQAEVNTLLQKVK